ncbi:hypothetical protein AAZV13_18G016500 [Glycine max]
MGKDNKRVTAIKQFYNIEDIFLMKFTYLDDYFVVEIVLEMTDTDDEGEEPTEELLWQATIPEYLPDKTYTMEVPEHVVRYIMPQRPKQIVVSSLPDDFKEKWSLLCTSPNSFTCQLGQRRHDYMHFFQLKKYDNLISTINVSYIALLCFSP